MNRIVIKLFPIHTILMLKGDKHGGGLFVCLWFFCLSVGGFLHCYGIEMVNITKLTQDIVDVTSVAMGLLQCSTGPSVRLSAGSFKPFP